MSKAILLLSGGLDSTLAGKVLLEQGIEVEALNFTSPFCQCTPKGFGCSAARRAAEQLGIPVHVLSTGQDYLEVMKRPRFGRGRGVNACIDCRIHIFRRARDFMEEKGADFVATGEVLGERPMSQRRNAMEIIERESGLQGWIVRPLCAQHMPPSIPEQRGLVERAGLLKISGRCRKPQIQMAKDFGLSDYPCPAGGCLLTNTHFAAKFLDLLKHEPDFGLHDARLLRVGRHFRLPCGPKAILGRSQEENEVIERSVQEDDTLLKPRTVPGPSALLRRSTDPNAVRLVGRIMAGYTKSNAPLELEIQRGTLNSICETLLICDFLEREKAKLMGIGVDD